MIKKNLIGKSVTEFKAMRNQGNERTRIKAMKEQKRLTKGSRTNKTLHSVEIQQCSWQDLLHMDQVICMIEAPLSRNGIGRSPNPSVCSAKAEIKFLFFVVCFVF